MDWLPVNKMAADQQYFPSEWNDEDRMNFMFSAFPEHRQVNQKHWDSKLQFWTKLILDSCRYHDEFCVDFETLRRRFSRKGLAPLGLTTVLKQMLNTRELDTLSNVTSGIDDSWMSWGFGVVKSVSWSVLGLWTSERNEENGEVFVVTALVKEKAQSLLNMHLKSVEHEATDHIIPWNVLRARCKKEKLNLSDKDLDLVLCYLQKQRKATVRVTDEDKVIKFVSKTACTISAVSEKDIGILRLKKTIAMLTLQINKLISKSESCNQKAKELSAQRLKQSAIAVLKKKQGLQKTLNKFYDSLHTLEELLHRIQQADTDKMIVDTLKSGSVTLKAVQEGLCAKDVDQMMLDLEETLDDAEEIQQAIAQGNLSLQNDIDLEDLEQELAGLSLQTGDIDKTGEEAEGLSERVSTKPVQSWEFPQVPSHNPTGQVPSHNSTGQVPFHNPTGQVPSHNPTGQVPSHNPTGQVPSHNPTGQVPSHNPTGQVPSHNPTDQVPSHNPTGQVSSHNPTGQVPSHNPTGSKRVKEAVPL